MAALIDLELVRKIKEGLEALGMYNIIDFLAYPLSLCIIFNNRVALYVVNNVNMLVLGTFKLAITPKMVEAKTQAFPIKSVGQRVIKGVLNRASRKGIEDLTLNNVVVVEGFHLNIVLEAYLRVKGV